MIQATKSAVLSEFSSRFALIRGEINTKRYRRIKRGFEKCRYKRVAAKTEAVRSGLNCIVKSFKQITSFQIFLEMYKVM